MIKFYLTVVLFILLMNTQALPGTPSPYLQPEVGFFGYSIFAPYLEAVSERLLSSSGYRQCQAVFLPSFSEESAVYLKYDINNKNAPPVVVSVNFKRQLWTEMQILMETSSKKDAYYHPTDPEAQKKILPQIKKEVNLAEAPIDSKIADILERSWNAMLIRVRYPENVSYGLDGETIHFANIEAGVSFRAGMVWSPIKGTLSYEFVELAKTLREYPKLRKSERKKASQDILKKAQDLLYHIENSK